MSYCNYQSIPFWEFIQSMDAAGAGVDRPAFGFGAAPPHGPPPPFFGFGGAFGRGAHHGWGRGGFHRRGGPPGCHHHRGPPHCTPKDPKDPEKDPEKDPQNPEDPPKDGEPQEPGNPNYTSGEENAEGPSWGPWAYRRGGHRHGRWGRHHGPPGPSPFGGPGGAPFDMSGLMNAFANHPIAQALRSYVGAQQDEDDQSFTPPVDIFSTPSTYVLHVALPGAKKEDVGVNWDAEKNELNVAGVVYRQGDEEFLKTLTNKERKVGMFERNVHLPLPEEEKEEIDGDNISARMEDGVLIVTVPKVEKEWTEVKKVDIE
jgi:HSP20 family protein